jgi:acetylornithine deacetylase/succinyl-diaminopimelate desuccinylase-like protein
VLQDCAAADWGNDPDLGKGTFNIGMFAGGEASNVVPGSATASVMIRLVESRITAEQRLHKAVGGRAEVKVIRCQRIHIGCMSSTDSKPWWRRLEATRHIWETSASPAHWPGSILDAHTAHEKISRQEMIEGAAIYERLVKKLIS